VTGSTSDGAGIRSPRMARHHHGPQRARSVESYLKQTRVLAAIALVVFAAGVVSDDANGGFWRRHALLASLVGSVLVVMVSLAVVNEVLDRRRRRRWSVLAQYVMFELVRNARMIWSGVLDVAGLLPNSGDPHEVVSAGGPLVRDTGRLTAAVRDVVADPARRSRLQTEVAFMAEHSNEVLGRWAAVMLNAALYAEIIDRHVELAGDVTWIEALLDSANPPHDIRSQRRARGNAALQIWGDLGSDWLADRIVVITQLAETLDRGTLDIALRIVPVQWWQERLSTNDAAEPSAAPHEG
jgi:hypothetical protein